MGDWIMIRLQNKALLSSIGNFKKAFQPYLKIFTSSSK
ncbi:hypothetical protein HPHPP4D_0012 [Helicobacter pylori Hp P-4d]|uniref:Uncharacterized protein n=1 Tax=Helicobacter pylori Hp P-4 TaxID=992075 RepID=J0PP79_HELPX|nr:hypothetical protein HPHPP4_1700 [Helicobacter pylori Hp P-4]EJC24074.1 hypothetical protein HPHPP4C_0013 [Helicobacter pylori Hp P-4c]EJC25290.1 hypothetical protein HPHPP4D_0012 [Helicobacter pylori Hp P-4d]